jgi:hypothetical protein
MKHVLIALLLTICFCSVTFAQEAQDAKSQKLLEKAAKNGNGLQTQINVNGNVHAQAVLIPYVDARRIFGEEIAKNYAVIEVNVSNKSQDAALILHGVFIDYSRWPLSGATPSELNASVSTDNYQASSSPNQVATEEYRVVRGQLLDAQTDTWRNRFVRWLTLAGNLAGAFTFSINERGIVKGIAAATGVGIPGVATAWPDKTIEQLNRVSDFGFRTNTVINKQGSEVVVCFFPIDRFLTPGFRKLFLKSPALFFAPLQMLVDKTIKKDVEAAVGELLAGLGFSTTDLIKELPCYMKIRHPVGGDPGFNVCLNEFGLEVVKDPTTHQEVIPRQFEVKPDTAGTTTNADRFKVFMALEFIGSVSLNRVVVTVDGVMSVDVNTIAARIDEVEIGKVAKCGDAGSECFWTDITADGGIRKGIIHGSYLTGGTVALAEQQGLQISDLKTITEESTDEELHFSFKLGLPVPSQTKLHFTVSKPQPASTSANGKPLQSNAFEYLVAYSPTATGIDSISLSGNTLTVKGRGFDPAMVVTLHSETGEEKQVPAASVTAVTSGQFDVAIPAGLKPGCWDVQVQAGGLSSNYSDKFAVEPVPTLDSAVRTDMAIVVTGTDLVDFSHCGNQRISFKFLPDPPAAGAAPAAVPLNVQNWNNGKPVLSLPPGTAKTDTLKGKVQVFLNGTLVAPNGEAQLKTNSQ